MFYKFIVTGNRKCENGDDICRQVRQDVGINFFNGISQGDGMGIIFDRTRNTDDLGLNIDLVYDLLQVYVAAIRLDIGHWTNDNVSSSF